MTKNHILKNSLQTPLLRSQLDSIHDRMASPGAAGHTSSAVELSSVIEIVADLERSLGSNLQTVALRLAGFEKIVNVDLLNKRIQDLESAAIADKERMAELAREQAFSKKKLAEMAADLDSFKRRSSAAASSAAAADPSRGSRSSSKASKGDDESRGESRGEEEEAPKRAKKAKRRRDDDSDDSDEEEQQEDDSTDSEDDYRFKSRKSKSHYPPPKKASTALKMEERELYDYELRMLFEDIEGYFSKSMRRQLYDSLSSNFNFKKEIDGICGGRESVNREVMERFFSEITLSIYEQRQIQLECWRIMNQDKTESRGRPMGAVGLHKRAKDFDKMRKKQPPSKQQIEKKKKKPRRDRDEEEEEAPASSSSAADAADAGDATAIVPYVPVPPLPPATPGEAPYQSIFKGMLDADGNVIEW